MKKILFVILGIIFVPFMLFINTMHDREGGGWYDSLWSSGNIINKLIFLILAPLFWGVYIFMYLLNESWESLAE